MKMSLSITVMAAIFLAGCASRAPTTPYPVSPSYHTQHRGHQGNTTTDKTDNSTEIDRQIDNIDQQVRDLHKKLR